MHTITFILIFICILIGIADEIVMTYATSDKDMKNYFKLITYLNFSGIIFVIVSIPVTILGSKGICCPSKGITIGFIYFLWIPVISLFGLSYYLIIHYIFTTASKIPKTFWEIYEISTAIIKVLGLLFFLIDVTISLCSSSSKRNMKYMKIYPFSDVKFQIISN